MNQATEVNLYPDTLYYSKCISESGHQPVFKKILPDGKPQELSPKPSQELINHSPDGFQWGYSGSGPAQLALALLFDATNDSNIAKTHYQDFKWEVVACWYNEWEITRQEILGWLRNIG